MRRTSRSSERRPRSLPSAWLRLGDANDPFLVDQKVLLLGPHAKKHSRTVQVIDHARPIRRRGVEQHAGQDLLVGKLDADVVLPIVERDDLGGTVVELAVILFLYASD